MSSVFGGKNSKEMAGRFGGPWCADDELSVMVVTKPLGARAAGWSGLQVAKNRPSRPTETAHFIVIFVGNRPLNYKTIELFFHFISDEWAKVEENLEKKPA
jgi:hypothetical protein